MTHRLSGTLAEAGEFGLVAALTSRFPQAADVLLGPGDDAAVVRAPGDQVVASLDMLVQGRHFRLDWSSAADIGHKAAAANLSDINAMGGRPTSLLVGLAAPPELETSWALEFADGLAEEASSVGASVVGGDLARADTIVIGITALGVCEHGVVRRSGARPEDVVALAGRQGWASAGFAVLGRGFRSPRIVVDAHRRPSPPYAAGPEAARLGATAMIDVSDGLLQDIGHVAAASDVAIDIESSSFDMPEPLQAVGAALGVDPLRFVLTGGDDYSLVATFPPDVALPQAWRPIGRVLGGADAGTVTVDGAAYDDPVGHQHFR
ncbi:MAG: thiamine-phosphate kinase [Actinomycetota bacterium]|nr:thiamine-phosphate kinase [Actinomycetota bacterium]